MAQLYIRCGMHDEALKTYHYILILLQQQDSSAKRTEMAATLSSMGLVYYALRDYSSALQHYKQVLTIQSHLQHDNDDTGVHRHFEIATTLNSIG
ncbi:expressed unknown protein [Seminavis robusta]|nr:expressed unknown protein [Seminavis robusta]|eukprot:Sro2576_g331770.1 n/a (95) ;mRNA; f:12924-13208